MPEQIAKMLNLNIRALVGLTGHVLPTMLERQSGWILNVGSCAAFTAMPFLSVYAATKAFVRSFSDGLAAEVRGSGVAVTCVHPGTTRTEFFDNHSDRQGLREQMLKHAMSPDRVARIAIRALSRGRSSVVCGTGNHLLVAGTWLLPRRLVTALVARVLRSGKG